ncbi:hypothetical protein DIE23_23890 [Burkholderia sp. Bp9143]|nr:hypothetical protein DIE23_23890 [Burkholderia sp. Bp9143]
MNLFRGNEPEGEPRGGAVAGMLLCANRTKHGRRDDDAGALYRAVAPGRRRAAHGRAAFARRAGNFSPTKILA